MAFAPNPMDCSDRTGAIYKIQAGDRVWHLNMNEPAVQNYTPGPALIPRGLVRVRDCSAGRRLLGISDEYPDR